MQNSNNEHPQGKLKRTFRVAKKLSETGLHVFKALNKNSVDKITSPIKQNNIIEGVAQERPQASSPNSPQIQQLFDRHLPQISQFIFGKYANKINQASNLISEQKKQQISDYFFVRLNQFSDQTATVSKVLDQAGVKSIEALQKDLSRSARLSQALIEQNKWIVASQGALSGITGIIGIAIDIPASTVIALRSIYQTGRAYGFVLDETDQDVVYYIFNQLHWNTLTEKHGILLALNALRQILKDEDLTQLQKLIGSHQDIQRYQFLFMDENGQLKWQWLNKLPKFSTLRYLTPVVAGSISAGYSWKFIEDVGAQSQHVFSVARDYLQLHEHETELNVLAAYKKAVELQKNVPNSNHLIDINNENEKEATVASDEAVAPSSSKDNKTDDHTDQS
ncbi:MAG: EcsC family protein [Acinetobacter sp.]